MKDVKHDFIPKRLQQIRLASHLTQTKLANILNISRSCLANYETGKRVPDDAILTAMAQHFNVEKSYFLKDNTAKLSEQKTDSLADKALKEIIETGKLDIRSFSLSSKMALFEYYNYLTEQEAHKTS